MVLHNYAERLAEKKNSRYVFIQSEVKQKPILIRSHTFTRAFRRLQVFVLSFEWFTRLSVFFVIG